MRTWCWWMATRWRISRCLSEPDKNLRVIIKDGIVHKNTLTN